MAAMALLATARCSCLNSALAINQRDSPGAFPSSPSSCSLRPLGVSSRTSGRTLLRWQQSPVRQHRRRLTSGPIASGVDPLGDFGARDPYPAEVESNFNEKCLGLADTEHRILLPKGLNDVAGLSSKSCVPLTDSATAMSEADAREYLKRVVGWRLVPLTTEETKGGAALCLQGEWKVRGPTAGEELTKRIRDVADKEAQDPKIDLDTANSKLHVTIFTAAAGGLTENDFILAAKIDKLEIKDLLPKAKFWA